MQMNSKLRVFLGTMVGLLVGIAGGVFSRSANEFGRACNGVSLRR